MTDVVIQGIPTLDLTTDAARVAALRAGSVDVIDLVGPADLPSLRRMDDINVFQTGSLRLVYLALNQRADMPAFTTPDGRPLAGNPLRDARVRRALSLLIDRRGLTDYILQGAGDPATQIVPDGVFGYADSVRADGPDPERARRHWELMRPGLQHASRLQRGCDVGRALSAEEFARLDMESRWQMWLRARFQGVWRGSPTRLEQFPQGRS